MRAFPSRLFPIFLLCLSLLLWIGLFLFAPPSVAAGQSPNELSEIFPAPLRILNEHRADVGTTASPEGSYRYVSSTDTLVLTLPKSADGAIRLRFQLPRESGFFWTWNASLGTRNPHVEMTSALQSFSADGRLTAVERFPAEIVPQGDFRFLNRNLKQEGNIASQVFVLEFHKLPNTASDPSKNVEVHLRAPQLLKKKDFLGTGGAINYIDADTLLNLDAHQNQQLEELFGSGRQRIWVLPLRNDRIANRVREIVRAHPQLSRAKFLLNSGGLVSRQFCDIAYYRRNGVETFSAPPEFLETADGPEVNPPPTSTHVALRQNCVNLRDARDPRTAQLLQALEFNLQLANMFGDQAAGFYLLDEPASWGVPAAYLHQIYSFLGKHRGDLPVVLTHSFSLGLGLLADRFPDTLVERYYSPDAADIFFFDHYSIPSIRKGSIARQQRFFDFLGTHGMLGKPFVRLLGTGTNDRNPCDLDKRGFLDIYRRTFAVRELLPLEMRRNWQPNLGFWAFFNRLPRRDQNVRWSGTLAWQPEGFCEAQYQAVLDLSTNARR